MANTPEERRKLKYALSLIHNKYADWLNGNARLTTLFGADDAKFDTLIHFLDNAEFMKKYLLIRLHLKANCTINGFFSTAIPPFVLFINRTTATDSTLIHELFHLLTHDNFSNNIPNQLDEGITEYFTRKIQGRIGELDALKYLAETGVIISFDKKRENYNDEFKSVNATRGFIKSVINPTLRESPELMPELNGINTKNMFKRAYFKGEQTMIDLIRNNSNLK